MNMLALRCGDDIILIDAGMMFPEAELLGVDIVIPDITYLKQNRDKLRAILLTHGHEDHIGALPYILRDLRVPVYGTQFTLALVRRRLEEFGLLDQAKLNEVAAGETITIGPFGVEFIHVTHSTIDCVALAIRTPLGVVIHTGDFKMDSTPIDGHPFDFNALARYGSEGVLALFSDSTNVERPGYTPSERAVRAATGGTVPRGAAESAGLLLRQFHSAHPAGDRNRRGRGTQDRVRRAQHGGQRRDRARSGAAEHSRRHGGARAGRQDRFLRKSW